MTPYELSKLIHTELSPIAPKLSASLNRALNEIGEGSVLVGLGKGTNINDDVSFQEAERINTKGDEPANIISKIKNILWKLEEHSSWKVIIDKKPGTDSKNLELLYTIFRKKGM